MAVPKIMSGARALVYVNNKLVGIFKSCGYGLQYSTQPVSILGAYAPVEIEYTGAEPVSVSCTGYRAVGSGPHQICSVPRLQDLITHEYIEFVVIDRATQRAVATIKKCRPTGFSTSISDKQLEEMTLNYIGLLVDDENTENVETNGAASLP